MFKAIFKYNFFLIFAIAFAIPVVILGIILSGSYTNANIVNNGIETIGHIIPDSYYSNLTVNGVNYYHIDYYFLDEKGNTIEGQTSDTFLYSDILDIIDVGYIKIKYNPDTLESIESTYNLTKDSGFWGLMIAFGVFGLCDIVFWIISIKTIKDNIVLIKVEKYGSEYDAMVTYISSNVRVNGVPMYKVHYTWVNDMGQECVGSSRSKYRYYQAEALEKLKKIHIKAIGRKSYITTNPDDIHIEMLEQTSQVDESALENVDYFDYCDYCGHKLSTEDTYCPNCRAQRKF